MPRPRSLQRGNLLPDIVTEPPGPKARDLSRRLAAAEAPGINTLYGGQPNIQWQAARGANVLDVDGNRYLDFTSGFGVAAVGHRHPRVVAAIREQSGVLVHGLGDAMGHEPRVLLAERLQKLAPMADATVYFAVSGADAVEIAIKTAVLATGKPALLVFEPSYHGLTLGALAASSRAAFRTPFQHHLSEHLVRLPFACDSRRVERALRKDRRIGCLMVEPIVGREGVLVPPEGWLRQLAEICREHQVLFAVDEILTGFGRTGEWFAVAREKLSPDLLCCGKALGGGLPIAAVLGRRSVFEAWDSGGEALHTATFVAHPLSCTAALAVLDLIEQEGLLARVRHLGARLADRLRAWPERFRQVEEIRGRGLMWGIELTKATAAGAFVSEARRRGILLLAGGHEGRVAQLLPPFVITDRQLDAAMDLLEAALATGD